MTAAFGSLSKVFKSQKEGLGQKHLDQRSAGSEPRAIRPRASHPRASPLLLSLSSDFVNFIEGNSQHTKMNHF